MALHSSPLLQVIASFTAIHRVFPGLVLFYFVTEIWKHRNNATDLDEDHVRTYPKGYGTGWIQSLFRQSWGFLHNLV